MNNTAARLTKIEDTLVDICNILNDQAELMEEMATFITGLERVDDEYEDNIYDFLKELDRLRLKLKAPKTRN